MGLALGASSPADAAPAPVPPPPPAPTAAPTVDPQALPAPRIWWPLDPVARAVPGTQAPVTTTSPPAPPTPAPAPPPNVAANAAGTTTAPATTPQPTGARPPAREPELDDDLPPAARPAPVEPPESEPPETVVATTEPPPAAPGSGSSAAKEPKKTSSGPSGSELTFGLSPELSLPRVQATLPESGLAPPTPEVRRWTFAAPEGGLTWESEESSKEGEWIILRGQVDIRAGVERIQADEVRLNQSTMKLEAEGNVILDRLDSRMAGKSLEYDVRTNLGVVHEAFGTTGEDLSFTAEVAEKVGPDKYLLRGASFTSCTQPGPIWQVKASKAIVHIDHFVYMWNPRVVFGKVPAFYLPWVAIPIKDERSTGFMIPRIGNSSTRGFTVGEEFFWAINRQTDMTLGATYWDKFGYRADVEARWFLEGMPEYGFIKGAFVHANDDWLAENAPSIDDPSAAQDRYDVVWEHRQSFGAWDLTATGEVGSDQFVNYDLPGDEGIGDLQPIFNQRFTVQRTWGHHTLNLTAENNEEETETTVPAVGGGGTSPPRDIGKRTDIDRKLPTAEYRTSGLQLGGRKWASLSMEASVGHIQQIEKMTYLLDYDPPTADESIEETTMDHDYERADFYPQLRLPVGTSWLQIVPELNVRASWWSRREDDPRSRVETVPVQAGGDIAFTKYDGLDEGLFMWGWDAGLTFEGPDFSRIYNLDAQPGQRKWQHLIEPSIEYSYSPESEFKPILQGDQYRSYWSQRFPTLDATGVETRDGIQSHSTFRLVNTLRNKVVAPEGEQEEQARDWLIWTLSTDYDFEHPSSTGTIEGRPETNWWGDMLSDMNFKPSELTHFSLRNTYNVLQDDITSTSLVGGVGGHWGYVDVSVNAQRDTSSLDATSTDLTLTGEHWFYKGDRMRIGYDISRKIDEVNPPAGSTPWLYKRFVFSYYNQCVGFSLSWEDQALRGSIPREQEWIFTVSLKDLGNFLRYKKSNKP